MNFRKVVVSSAKMYSKDFDVINIIVVSAGLLSLRLRAGAQKQGWHSIRGWAEYPYVKKCQSMRWYRALAGSLRCTMVLGLIVGTDVSASTQAYSPRAKCVQVTIVASDSRVDGAGVKIIAEAAISLAERQKGLMHRTQLPQGMLFLFQTPQIISMWMKNTPKSLDILFISPENRIINIERETVPFSLKTVSAKAPATAALEMPAGTTKLLKPGDVVKWTPHFFPCPRK